MQIVVQFRMKFLPFLYPVIAGFLHSIILKLSKKAIKYIKDKSLYGELRAIKTEKREFLKLYFCSHRPIIINYR